MFKDKIVTKIRTEEGYYLTDAPCDFLVSELAYDNRKWIGLNVANASNFNKFNKLLLNFDYVKTIRPITKEEVNDIEQKANKR